jgi:hypothetical protein
MLAAVEPVLHLTFLAIAKLGERAKVLLLLLKGWEKCPKAAVRPAV